MKKPVKKTGTAAFHQAAADGIHHTVGIISLHVMIVPDGDVWFAQGLELDYAVQGKSPKDARKQFTEGLKATIKEHLRVFGTIEKLLKIAPQQVWDDLLFSPGAIPNKYSAVNRYHMESETLPADLQQVLPFASIDYVETRVAA